MATPGNEAATRRARIDPRLEAAGWTVVAYDQAKPLPLLNDCAITEFPTENGPADYALCVDGLIVGIVEAKKLSLAPQEVLKQAERYARGLAGHSPFNFEGLRVPFLYSTNGEIIWHRDVRHPLNRSRQIAGFHTPDALAERVSQQFDALTSTLAETPNDHERVRDYQREANDGIEKAIAERKRAMLVAMATGTGKTFTMVNEVYRLMKAGVAKRALFLVDRKALAAQAVRAFASFEAEPGRKFDQIYEVYSQKFHREDLDDERPFDPKALPETYLTAPRHGDAFVYVCTIQRMTINLFGRDAVFGVTDEEIDEDADRVTDIPIHAFDLVIADECHRGYTAREQATWARTLDHFDAVKIGLTATPAHHTTSYFKDVVYRYPYERAVREGFLVDYDVVAISSNVRMNGVFLAEGERVDVVDPETGAQQLDLLEDERTFDATEIEQKVTAPDSNRKILEEIKKYADEHEARYGRFPKTLVFAVNDLPHTSHADQLVDIARDVFGQGDDFVQKITGRVDRPLQRIREFRNRKLPGVVVTVDMLSTGVDIPDLEYIVFLRPVKSRILFEQMLGRGTRRGEHWQDKSHFTVFDCFDGTLLEYFRQSVGIAAEPPLRVQRTNAEIIEDIWQNRDRDYNIRCLVKRLQRVDKQMSGDASPKFAAYIPDGDVGHFAASLPRLLDEGFTKTMDTLRDEGFQDLLLTYPRPPRAGFIVTAQEDEVSSEWRVKDSKGNEYKPKDYLEEFSRFVSENPDHITAIEILLKQPKGWGTDPLVELQTKLAAAQPLPFSVDLLQRAHDLSYHKALVDIISMVKHAASQEEPLLTAEERVRNAIARVTAGQEFTEEQQLWLERIKAHLVENLSIERNDFDVMPVFERHGGWGRADGAFDGELAELIDKLNEAVAA